MALRLGHARKNPHLRISAAPPYARNLQAGNVALEEHDPEMFDLIEREKNRQWKGLELIASEVRPVTPAARSQAIGAVRTWQ
jgi:hypothetical protein